MAFYLNTELSQKKTLFKTLQNIYGIGNTTSLFICKKTGINPKTTLNHLSKKKLNILFLYIKINCIINEKLKKKNQEILINKKKLKIKK